MKVKVTQLCPTLSDLMDSRVRGILQARILEWVAVPFSRGSSQPRDRTQVSCIAGGFCTTGPLGKPRFFVYIPKSFFFFNVKIFSLSPISCKVKVTQSCPTLCDPMDFTVHGTLQARILEWVAFPFSRGSFQPRGSNPGLPHCRFFTSWATRGSHMLG